MEGRDETLVELLDIPQLVSLAWSAQISGGRVLLAQDMPCVRGNQAYTHTQTDFPMSVRQAANDFLLALMHPDVRITVDSARANQRYLDAEYALRKALADDMVEAPSEPTPQMIRAGSIAHEDGYPVWVALADGCVTMQHVIAAYRAMIAAAAKQQDKP